MLKPRSSRPRMLLAAPLPAEGDRGEKVLGNDEEITVSALAGALKRTVEDRFGHVRVRGEISNYRGPHSSGHAYFSLKDEGARLDAVIWKTSLSRLRIKPEEGMDVVATGRITTFPGKSAYQIVIEQLEPAGVGALMAALEERRRRLLADGLFESARKRPLPFLPRVIGVVTSPTGAVIRDILHRIADRFATPVLLWPVRVQGETCAVEVTQAIEGFNRFDAAGRTPPRPDVLIIARGGGSLEDLWGFNDETLVRAAAASVIPLISAIGHETDWTLLDHVADLRAPTPTGAAELAVPVKLDLALRIDRLEERRTAAVLRLLAERRRAFRAAARVLPAGSDLVSAPRQRFDHAAMRLPGGLATGLAGRRLSAARLGGRLTAQAPRARLARLAQHLDALGLRLSRAGRHAWDSKALRLTTIADRLATARVARQRLEVASLDTRRQQLERVADRLVAAAAANLTRRRIRFAALIKLVDSLGYRSTLARGFVLVRNPEGDAVRRAADLEEGVVSLEFVDGRVAAIVGPESRSARIPRPKARSSASAVRQGSLF